MKIFIGSDHAGFELKRELIPFLQNLGYEVEDLGAPTPDPEDDYPDFIIPVAKAVAKDREAKGIVIGGSGEGEAVASNRIPHIRAVVWYGGSRDILKLSREHNDANILSLGARFISKEEALEAVKYWLECHFSGDERHVRRIAKIDNHA